MNHYFKKVSPIMKVSSWWVNELKLLSPQESLKEEKNEFDIENLPSDLGHRCADYMQW